MTGVGNGAVAAFGMAMAALRVVSEDEAMIERLKVKLAEADAPIKLDGVNATTIEMSADALLLALALLRSDMAAQHHDHGGHDHEVFAIPVPRDGNLNDSATALAVGSFTTEYVHTDPERLAAFNAWLDATHPSSDGQPHEVAREDIDRADGLLTVMSHAARSMSDAGIGVSSFRGAQPYPHDTTGRNKTTGQYPADDGTRNV